APKIATQIKKTAKTTSTIQSAELVLEEGVCSSWANSFSDSVKFKQYLLFFDCTNCSMHWQILISRSSCFFKGSRPQTLFGITHWSEKLHSCPSCSTFGKQPGSCT